MSNTNTNQPQKAPSVSATIDKKERKQLWEALAKFCNELIEETNKNGYAPKHRFAHPQPMIDIFIKLGLRPPNNPRGLEKFYDNFIKKCKYLSDNANNNKINKNLKNNQKINPKKWTLKGQNNHTKYNSQNRGNQYYQNNSNLRSQPQNQNKIGSFPVSSHNMYHQYVTQCNMAKQQLITQLPAPRNPKLYAMNYNNHSSVSNNSLININNSINLQNIQIPLHLQNKQLTSGELMQLYQIQVQKQTYAQPQTQTQQQQQQQIIYHVQNDNYYQINVGQSNQNRVNMHTPQQNRANTRKPPPQFMANNQSRNSLRIAVDTIPKGLPRTISTAYNQGIQMHTPIPQIPQYNNTFQGINPTQQNRTFQNQNTAMAPNNPGTGNNSQNNNTVINMNTSIIGPHSFGLQSVPELKENYTPQKHNGTIQIQVGLLPGQQTMASEPNRRNSLNVQQNNIIRSNLLEAQAFMVDSNASNFSNFSSISAFSARSCMSDGVDVTTLGFINTDTGAQVSALFEYLQNAMNGKIICLDLNAVRSRSVSISMGNRHARKPTDDMQGMVFNQDSIYNPNDIETIHEKNFFAQVTNLNENAVSNYESYQNNKLDTLWNKLSNKSSNKSNGNYQNNKLDHLFKSMSNKSNASAFSAGSIRRGSFAAPHNDLDGLVIFEPVKPFEILDLYRSRTNDAAFESVREQFEKALQKAFAGCVKYLKHRMKHTVSQIKSVFFVTFAMPTAVDNVSSAWYDLCQLRMEHITNTARKCHLLCEQNKMKFVGCITPVDPNSFHNKTDKITEEDIYSNDFLAKYHLPDYAKYQVLLPFKNTAELSECIQKTLKPQIK